MELTWNIWKTGYSGDGHYTTNLEHNVGAKIMPSSKSPGNDRHRESSSKGVTDCGSPQRLMSGHWGETSFYCFSHKSHTFHHSLRVATSFTSLPNTAISGNLISAAGGIGWQEQQDFSVAHSYLERLKHVTAHQVFIIFRLSTLLTNNAVDKLRKLWENIKG